MKKLITLICSVALAVGSATDSSAQAVVEIAATNAEASEGANAATFELRRTGGDGDIQINLGIDVAATDATPDEYTLEPQLDSIIIPEGSLSVTITFTAADDDAAEADEALVLALLAGDYIIGNSNSASVTIPANDFVVTNPDDFATGASAAEREGTLRQAIANANASAGPETISFSDDPFSDGIRNTISLSGGEILIRRGVTIDGPGADLLTLNGVNSPRIFRISADQGASKMTFSGINFALAGTLDQTPGTRGGAIFAEDGAGGGGLDLSLIECAFSGNSAAAGAGLAFDNNGGTLLVERCVFDGNQASQEGGALAFDNGAQLRITDSTFATNFSNGRAGAILLNSGSAEITNTTIVGNRADEDSDFGPSDTGGGLWVNEGTPCLTNNSLIAGNSRAPTDPLPSDVAGALSPGSANNLISDPASSGQLSDGITGNIIGQGGSVLPISQIVQTSPFDRNVPQLADNGGPTLTVRLTRASQAVDAGDSSLVSPSGLDQRGDGFARIRSGFPSFQPDPGTVDIGAIEFDPILVTTVEDEISDNLQTSLREAIAVSNQKPGDDLIVFSRGLNNSTNFYDAAAPKTIVAETGEFVITDGVEIDGPGADLLTLSGDANMSDVPDFGDNRIFNFAGNDSIEIPPRNRLWRMTLANASPQITDQPGDGGAILNTEGVLEIFDSVFRNNKAQRGGAIFNSASLMLFRVTLEDNEAFGEGGAIYAGETFGGGALYSYSSTYFQNRATWGGALFTGGGQIRIFNSTLSSNDAVQGGGLYYTEGDVQITNSTIAENTSSSDTPVSDKPGGGIDLSGAISTPLFDLDNTIVAANTAGGSSPSPSDIAGVGLAATSSSNLISDAGSSGGLTDGNNGNLVGIGGAGNLTLADLLDPIGDNGGPTQTYRPIDGSLVIDSGDNQSAVFSSGGAPLDSDQRGLPRIVLGIVDIGSVEIQSEAPILEPIGDQVVEALSTLTLTATTEDPDIPENFTFSLDALSIGRGMEIDPEDGEFQWTPDSSQAPGDYLVTISLSDDGAPPLVDTQSFNIEVTQGALPVVSLSAIGGAALHEPASFSKSPPPTPPATSFRISRSGQSGGDFPVTLQISELSQAEHGSDFGVRISGNATQIVFSGDPLGATISIPDDETSVDLIIDVIDDAAAEADEVINLAIAPQAAYDIGAGALVQVIAQNDFGVTNLGDFDSDADPDGGEGTLRRAVINAKAGLQLPEMPPAPADITFDPALLGTIELTGGALEFDTADFSISGPGSGILGVSAGLNSRVIVAYEPDSERSYRISGLGIEEGATSRNGGGIFNSEGLVLENCTISGCLAENGGGISNEGELTMIGCLVTMNTAAVYGGGIDNFGGSSSIHQSTISGNSANFGGGIENSTSGTLRIESSTVAGNQATSSGGGIDSFTGATSASNLTVSANRAGFGAGLFNEASSLTIVQSTIVENIAVSSGGGILASSNTPAGNTLMHNSIVAGNSEGGESPSDIATGNSSFVPLDPASSSNLIGDASSSGGLTNTTNNNLVGLGGSGLRPVGEIVSPLGDNGGPTATHALVSASMAIDAGDNALALDTSGAALQTDQRGAGFARIVLGSVDIGAFEIEPALPKIVSCEVAAGPEATITWESKSGEVYDVFCSSDLEHWLLVGIGIPSSGDLTSWTDTNPPSEQAYFIVRPAISR